MAGVLSWLKASASKVLDPDREGRVHQAAVSLEQTLLTERSAFQFEATVARFNIFREDIPLVTRKVYQFLVKRAWKDGAISDGERKTLHWAIGVLGLDSKDAAAIFREAAGVAFTTSLANAIVDGRIDAVEMAALHRIAAELRSTTAQLLREKFSNEGDGLFRSMFATAIADGDLTRAEWAQLLNTIVSLGLSQHEFRLCVSGQAEQLVVQVLADANADGHFDSREEQLVNWLLDDVVLRPEFREYVRGEMARVRLEEQIDRGHLPSIISHQAGLRAGEIVHLEVACEYRKERQLKSGPRVDLFTGLLTVTDSRLFFTSQLLGFEINHRKVLDLRPHSAGFHVTSGSKGTGWYVLGGDFAIGTRIYIVAVAMANQTKVREIEGDRPSRHIPRDVRQRVFQRCGGRCVECRATEYLEYDHIIPVARGGSNGDANVQLLCRKCNLTKSDNI